MQQQLPLPQQALQHHQQQVIIFCTYPFSNFLYTEIVQLQVPHPLQPHQQQPQPLQPAQRQPLQQQVMMLHSIVT